MSIDITLTDKQGNEINYDTNSMLSEVTHYSYINITYNLANMLQALPYKWPRTNWKNKELCTLIPQIKESITELYHHPQYYEFYDNTEYYNKFFYDIYLGEYGAGALTIMFCFLSRMLTLCACYPNAICHIREIDLGD